MTGYTLDEIERFDREWTNKFARAYGWEAHVLTDPVDDLRLFFNHIPGKLMLDSGCGWGRYVFRFVDEGLVYQGIDHSVEMLKVAKETNPEAIFLEGSFRSIPFPSEYFDGVWSCCTLASIPKKHLVEVLSEHKRVLRPEGVLVIVMPAIDWYGSTEEMHTDDNGNPEIYQAHYHLDEFCDYVEKAGFKIGEANYRWHSGSMYVLAKKPTI